jgi:hypothetical protein
MKITKSRGLFSQQPRKRRLWPETGGDISGESESDIQGGIESPLEELLLPAGADPVPGIPGCIEAVDNLDHHRILSRYRVIRISISFRSRIRWWRTIQTLWYRMISSHNSRSETQLTHWVLNQTRGKRQEARERMKNPNWKSIARLSWPNSASEKQRRRRRMRFLLSRAGWSSHQWKRWIKTSSRWKFIMRRHRDNKGLRS